MGQSTILENLGGGLYSIKVSRAENLITEKIAWIDTRLAEITDDFEKTALELRKRQLQALLADAETLQAWCADLSTWLTGTVDTLEINGEPTAFLIAPSNPGHNQIPAGVLTPYAVQSEAQAALNWAIFPGWQKFKPTYRLGEITEIDYVGHTCGVDLDPATCYINGADINQSETLSAVPIKYMNCDSVAFAVGSRVVVEFKDQDWATPQVIGFEMSPQSCFSPVIAIVSNTSGSHACAWDLYGNILFLPVASLAEIAAQLAAMGYDVPTEAVSDTAADSFTIPTATTHTHAGLYDQPTFLEGFYVGLDWELSVSYPVPSIMSYSPPGGHSWAWDYRFLEAPDFVKNIITDSDEYKKGCSVIDLKLFPGYTDSVKRAEFIALTGADWKGNVWIQPFQSGCVEPACPYGPERVYYFFHSVFDIPPGYAVKENLDITCSELLDSWADVYKGGTSPDGDPYNVGSTIGMAETDNGIVAFECVQACAKVNIPLNECEDAAMAEKRLFRVFAYQKEPLSGLAAEIVALVNEYRTDNGRKEVADNIGLLKASRRHAIDAAAHDIDGETGSDGSTLISRLTDAGYYLWLNPALTVYKFQSMAVDADLVAADVLSTWQADPVIDAALLSSNFIDVAAAMQTGDNSKDYLVFVMAGVASRWPGFCPIDTDDLNDYVIDNFSWSGDQLRLPRVYVV